MQARNCRCVLVDLVAIFDERVAADFGANVESLALVQPQELSFVALVELVARAKVDFIAVYGARYLANAGNYSELSAAWKTKP